jgi:hypothetical protein
MVAPMECSCRPISGRHAVEIRAGGVDAAGCRERGAMVPRPWPGGRGRCGPRALRGGPGRSVMARDRCVVARGRAVVGYRAWRGWLSAPSTFVWSSGRERGKTPRRCLSPWEGQSAELSGSTLSWNPILVVSGPFVPPGSPIDAGPTAASPRKRHRPGSAADWLPTGDNLPGYCGRGDDGGEESRVTVAMVGVMSPGWRASRSRWAGKPR